MNNTDWKNHPIVVAAVAVSAAIGLCVIIIKEIILPTYTAHLNNTIKELQTTNNNIVSENTRLKEHIIELKNKLDISEEKESNLLSKLELAQQENLFSSETPYPLGLGQIKIGDPVSLIFKSYPIDSIEISKYGYIDVNNQHEIFTQATYYADDIKNKNSEITHVSYGIDFKKGLSKDFLQMKLIDSFGMPKKWVWDDYYSWMTKSKIIIYKSSNNRMLLMPEGFKPRMWPEYDSTCTSEMDADPIISTQ